MRLHKKQDKVVNEDLTSSIQSKIESYKPINIRASYAAKDEVAHLPVVECIEYEVVPLDWDTPNE